MNLPTLYEIKEEYLSALIELTDLDDEAVVDTLDALKGTLKVKSANVAKFTEHLKNTIQGMKEAEQRIAQRRKTIERKIARLQQYIKEAMESTGILKIETNEIELTIVKNPPRVAIGMEKGIPDKYFNTKKIVSLDKSKLSVDLKNGVEVPGCSLESTTRLRIK